MREQLGVWLKDRWRYERALRSPTPEYLALANRMQPGGIGPTAIETSAIR